MTHESATTAVVKTPNFWFPLTIVGAAVLPILTLMGWAICDQTIPILKMPFALALQTGMRYKNGLALLFVAVFCLPGLVGALVALALHRVVKVPGWQRVLIWLAVMVSGWCIFAWWARD
jgi:hypothetical protein